MKERTTQQKQLVIRPANPMDAVNLVRLLKDSWSRSPMAAISSINEAKAFDYVTETLKKAFVSVGDVSGRLVGSIALAPIQHPWSDDYFMGQIWFVTNGSVHAPQAAQELLNIATDFLDFKGLPAAFRINEMDSNVIGRAMKDRKSEFQSLGAYYMRKPKPSKQKAAAA